MPRSGNTTYEGRSRSRIDDLAVGIVEVAEEARARGAGDDAARQQALGRALHAEGALLDDALGARRRLADDGDAGRRFLHRRAPVEDAVVVGAGDHAVAAADAAVVVHVDDAVGHLVGRLRRTGLHAGRVVAVEAVGRLIRHREVGERAGRRVHGVAADREDAQPEQPDSRRPAPPCRPPSSVQQPMHLSWSTTMPRRVAFWSAGSGTSIPGYDVLTARPLASTTVLLSIRSSPSRPFHLHEAVVVSRIRREVRDHRLGRIGDLVGQVVGVTLHVLLHGQACPSRPGNS